MPKNTPKEVNEYEPVSSVLEDLVAKLTAEHHKRLQAVRVTLVSRTQPAKKDGNPVLASSKIVTGLAAYLADSSGTFFVIEVCENLLNNLDEDTRTAVMDHALARCQVVGAKLSIRTYDVQEFSEVLHRRGPYHEKLRAFLKVARKHMQPELALADEDTDEVAV